MTGWASCDDIETVTTTRCAPTWVRVRQTVGALITGLALRVNAYPAESRRNGTMRISCSPGG
jgi:hypothetical protein